MQLVLPVIVLYKQNLRESPTFRTLSPQLSSKRWLVFVYDNSPVSQQIPQGLGIVYHRDPQNSGITAAYNCATSIAVKNGIPWMLLLDQDSAIPSDFVENLESCISTYAGSRDIVAVVPRTWNGKSLISPRKVLFGRYVPVQKGASGPHPTEISAVNSCAAVRTDFVAEIGGYDESYWLDFADHWFFRSVYAKGKMVAVMPIDVQHDLSVTDFRHRITVERYKSILSAETRFFATEKGRVELAVYVPRLLLRAAKQLFLLRRPRMSYLSCLTSLKAGYLFLGGRGRGGINGKSQHTKA
jgi:GT2 family glycosyltransferase